MKVAQLAAYVAEKSAYHHGEVSLADTIVKLANDYMGSNNINLLEPCGQFGTRLMGGKDASQTRYIFTKLTKDARKIFDPRDDPVLNYLDDDGRSIEPDFHMPTLPMVLVNGTEGIGTGFSCYVPPFNPKDIKENITRALVGQDFNEMKPWFQGSRLKVTELPPGRWTQDYKEHLDALVEKKVISGFTNNSTTDNIDFEIMGYTGKDILKGLKLRKSFHTSNMHLFHPTKGIYKYNSPEEILKDFVDLRLDHYKKRREYLIKVLEVRSKMCGYKSKFVTMVIEEDIVINGTHDYLLNIKTVQYTEESVRELIKESKQAREELEIMKGTSHIDMWKMDIKNM
ncbi:DNA topoisomerase 2-like [Hydractinia symbiolongicarpus]|uniref:DNA topoisomerase 2-like n=1 Tax=Hydractinia symbiolongicarpus TaxID=13093 RepID=UPI00254F9097|nr:DNA topoisomerase 2-like [Hydractinia symbiolongicarpus]